MDVPRRAFEIARLALGLAAAALAVAGYCLASHAGVT